MSLLTNFQDFATAVNIAVDRVKAALAKKADKTELSLVARSGNYSDLKNKPTFSTVAETGSYYDLRNTPNFATVATSGNYNDLNYRPTLAAVASSGSYNDLSNKPTYAAVATSGDYADLDNKPDVFEIFPVYVSNVTETSATLSESWEDILAAFQAGKRIEVFAEGDSNQQGMRYNCQVFRFQTSVGSTLITHLRLIMTYIAYGSSMSKAVFVVLNGTHSFRDSPSTTWTNTTTALN